MVSIRCMGSVDNVRVKPLQPPQSRRVQPHDQMGQPLSVGVAERDAAVLIEPGQGFPLMRLQRQPGFRVVVDQAGDGLGIPRGLEFDDALTGEAAHLALDLVERTGLVPCARDEDPRAVTLADRTAVGREHDALSAAVGLVSVFCGATNTLIPSILLAYELFGGVGLELIALGCGVCYMLSGTHGLYSSQTFVTNKLRPEYASHKWRGKLKKKEE